MECAELEEHLTEFLEGELDPAIEAVALEHLATCARCETVLAGTRSVMGLAARHGRVELADHERAELLGRILADDAFDE